MKTLDRTAWPLLVLLAFLLGCGTTSSKKPLPAPPTPLTVSPLEVAWLEQELERNPPRGEVHPPPDAPGDGSPAMALTALSTRLDALGDGSTRKKRGKTRDGRVGGARNAVARALAAYGTSPTPSVALFALADAARELEPGNAHPSDDATPELASIARELAGVARRIAGDLVQLAERSGVREPVLESARRSLDEGDQAVLSGLYSVAIGQFGGAADFVSGGVAFDIERFEQNLRTQVEGNTVGHAWVIVRDGTLFSASDQGDGDARTDQDPPRIGQSPYKEMYIASISKTLTAIALLRALDHAGISVDDSISNTIPSDWEQDPSIAGVTFRHLLTHRSGFPDPTTGGCCTMTGQTAEAMREVVAAGTPGVLDDDESAYTNANFSLMRILIPQIVVGEALIDALAVAGVSKETLYASLYASYVRNTVLGPAGVSAEPCGPGESEETATRYYSFPPPDDPGIALGNWFLSCGATGWYLSAIEVARVLAFLRYTETILDDPTRELMDDGFLGWLNPAQFAAFIESDAGFGTFRAHGGDSHTGSVPGMTGCTMNYPIRLQATLLINSRGNAISGHACSVLRRAYDEAWIGN